MRGVAIKAKGTVAIGEDVIKLLVKALHDSGVTAYAKVVTEFLTVTALAFPLLKGLVLSPA